MALIPKMYIKSGPEKIATSKVCNLSLFPLIKPVFTYMYIHIGTEETKSCFKSTWVECSHILGEEILGLLSQDREISISVLQRYIPLVIGQKPRY